MSIYATLWNIQIEYPEDALENPGAPEWVTICAQAVPAHIGSPTPGLGYEAGDPFGAFLPPPVETDKLGDAEFPRAVVFVGDDDRKGTARSGQEYVNPLLVLSGEEYAKMPFASLPEPSIYGESVVIDSDTHEPVRDVRPQVIRDR